MMSKDGRQLFIGFDGKVGYDVAGNFKQTHCILQDITNQRKAEKALIESEEKYRRITESVSDVVWTADLNLNTTYVSPSVVKLLGESAEAHIARSLDEKFVPYSLKEVQLILSQELEKEKDPTIDKNRTRIVEAEHYRADGSVIWISMHISFLRNENGEIIGFQGVSRDITQRKKVERELLYLSNHDHLTGLYNRRFFEEKLAKVDTEQNLPLSIIMCDVNGLKLVNDSFGHDSGDELLKNAAITIKNACRDEDVLARIGGDEFVIILPKTTAIETVHIANHIKELASKQKVSSIELSISYGYDTKTNMKQPIIEIIANAENHMYRHKLYERSSIRSKTIDLIMNALFEKSNREAMHSNRVSSICLSIATYMNFDKDAVHQMRIAGLIHDIGKIGVDEKILNKPGSLTIDERRNIERHPEIGWRLLSSTNDFSELAQFVLNHHEKWDGGGYPNGIKGESIPIEARIIAVADAYDAMTSKRSYKSGLDKKSAIDELMRCAGTQFDPKIVDVFVKHVLSDNSDFRGIGSFEV
jgi:diguanylate cyclase (GGDEF)-like protein/PAS domain S-box-containing protein